MIKHTIIAASMAVASAAQAQAVAAFIVVDGASYRLGTTATACPGKACAYYPINTAACTSKLMGGTGLNTQFGWSTGGLWMTWWCPGAKGPQLRILAGTWAGSMEAVECLNKSGKTPAQALPTCAPANVASPDMAKIWSNAGGKIATSKP